MKTRNLLVAVSLVAAVTAAVAFVSCGGSGGSTAVTASFPSDLAVASPFAVGGEKSGMVVGSLGKELENSVDVTSSYTEKKEALDVILSGSSATACKFPILFFTQSSPSPDCYGPAVDYDHHPDCPDTTGRGMCGADDDGRLPTGDVGIWHENQDGQACASAKISQMVDSVSVNVDTAINILAAMICSAKATGKGGELSMEAESAARDFKEELKEIISSQSIGNLTITKAELSRLVDSGDNPVFFYTVEGNVSDGTNEHGIVLYLKHIGSSESATYSGKLSFIIRDPAPVNTGNCAVDDKLLSAGSILYEKASSTELNYLLKKATFCDPTGSSNPLNDKYDIDASDTVLVSEDGWGNDFNYAVFNLNPSDGTGKYLFAWQAGPNDGNTRTFDAEITSSSNVNSGCAYFGFGADIKDFEPADPIDGFICNWAGPQNPEGDPTSPHPAQLAAHPSVQQQCFTLNATSGVYESDSDQLFIKYSPQNSCNYTRNDATPFTFVSEASGVSGETNDVSTVVDSFANNLKAIADVTLPGVSVPPDVY